MKSIISKYFVLSTLLLLSFSTYAVAGPALPTSNQVSDASDLPKSQQKAEAIEDEIEIVPEIKIETQSSNSPSNPKLKEGDACSDEHLEEAEGSIIVVVPALPMAKTVPCENVDCSDLKPAKVKTYRVKKLPPTAKTVNCRKP